ncbi:MAG: nucleotide pyrophosphohydrolase [Gemmatimonadaceae bacterium]|nr:nucleotide pyrophosphohydrolase [Gemmatimonadaceae bacterium]
MANDWPRCRLRERTSRARTSSAGTTRTSTSEDSGVLSPETLQALLHFRRERDWEQFHSPRNLAIAIAVEAGELLEQFQWMKDGESRPTAAQRDALELEMADVAILLSYLAADLDVDLDAAVRRKLAVNAGRYPVAKARGSAVKYDAL